MPVGGVILCASAALWYSRAHSGLWICRDYRRIAPPRARIGHESAWPV